MVCNASDRVIRTIHVPDLSKIDLNIDDINVEVEHKFQDVVNRLSWNHVAFSSTGEYVCATTYMNHDIYVWERGHGSLVKILEGPKEELGVVEVGSCSFKDFLFWLTRDSGIHIDRSFLLAASRQDGFICGPSSPRSVGQRLHRILPRSRKMLNILSVKTNSTFIRSKRFTSVD